MRRMQEDYDEARHTLPNWLGSWFSQDPAPHTILEERENEQADTEAQKEKNGKGWQFNFAGVALPLLFVIYLITYWAGLNLEHDDTLQINLVSSFAIVFADIKLCGVLTMWDDMELLF